MPRTVNGTGQVDPEQRQERHLRHPAQGPQDVDDVHRQLYGHPGDVEARRRAVRYMNFMFRGATS